MTEVDYELMAKEQTTLSFNQGITNVPGDATCDDNTLEYAEGLVYCDGEHRVVQRPGVELVGLGTATLLFVHKSDGGVRYVTKSGSDIRWGTKDGSQVYQECVASLLSGVSGDCSVTAVGRILVVNDGGVLHYFLWEAVGYKTLGTEVPDVDFDILLKPAVFPSGQNVVTSFKVSDWVSLRSVATKYENGQVYVGKDSGTTSYNVHSLYVNSSKEDQEALHNAIVGSLSERIDVVHKHGFFCHPFFLRIGVELYDGTVTKLGPPILVLPSVRAGACMVDSGTWGYFEPLVQSCSLCLKAVASMSGRFDDWKDLVRGVKVYATREVKQYEMDGNWAFVNPFEIAENQGEGWSALSGSSPFYASAFDGLVTDSVREVVFSIMGQSMSKCMYYSERKPQPDASSWSGYFYPYIDPPRKSDGQIMKELADEGVFYELFSVGFDELFVGGSPVEVKAEEKIPSGSLVNITTLPQLEKDDYFSHAIEKADGMFVYNSRLTLHGISRMAFGGFDKFIAYQSYYGYDFKIQVSISTNSGPVKVEHNVSDMAYVQGRYFYYPDPRAKSAKIYLRSGLDWKLIYDFSLQEHPRLHGAYHFGCLPCADDYFGDDRTMDQHYPAGIVSVPDTFTTSAELLPNVVKASEVNVPFVFPADGECTVGAGSIVSLSTQTQALSQGQFGQYPILVFTSDGIWAAEIDSSGRFSSVRPMSREVCVNGRSVTQTDGFVFFASKKGLMLIEGGVVRCVSDLLLGKTGSSFPSGCSICDFVTFLEESVIAYDYRDSLLWLFDGSVSGSRYCWLYSMKGHSFSMYDFGESMKIVHVVCDYPDTLLQDDAGNVYTLTGRAGVNADEAKYSCCLVSRPLKFGNALALKSIREISNVSYMYGSLKYRLYVSNDLKSWLELKSLRGMPWKYYKMRFDFSDMKATDRFAGSVIVTQERRTNKLR